MTTMSTASEVMLRTQALALAQAEAEAAETAIMSKNAQKLWLVFKTSSM
jgi:hypothetical protein